MADETANTQQTTTQEVKTEVPKPRKGPAHGWMAWLGFVLTAAAWVMLHFSGLVCFWLAVGGTVMSAIALRQRNRACHNLALTALVAAIVLLVVLGIVYVALHYLLG